MDKDFFPINKQILDSSKLSNLHTPSKEPLTICSNFNPGFPLRVRFSKEGFNQDLEVMDSEITFHPYQCHRSNNRYRVATNDIFIRILL